MKKRIGSILLSLALCLSLLPTAALAAEGEHSHYLCGGDTCSGGSHTQESSKTTFAKKISQQKDNLYIDGTNWTYDYSGSDHQYTLPAGNYYLGTDIEIKGSIRITDTATLCLNGYTITSTKGNVINVINGEFTLTDCKGESTEYGKITHNNNNGRGVYINNGTFNMYGGSITRNMANGGSGGGVYVKGGSFEMYGGSITGNTADGSSVGGGGVYVESGTFTMSGGTIGGTSEDNANEATSYGGGVYVKSGTFNMYGNASITGNVITGSGGGVYVEGGTFNMSGSASITGNTSKSGYYGGGGVYVGNRGTFNMSDSAKIIGNKVTGDSNLGGGGGVYVESGTFTMYGNASITGNNVSNDRRGGGVFVLYPNGFTVSDCVKITGNCKGGTLDSATGKYTGGSTSNVYLPEGKTITIGDAYLSDNASIGVTTATTPTTGSSVTIATGATSGDVKYFTADKGGDYHFELDNDEVKLVNGTPAATKTLSSIAVTTAPTKTTYTAGENFDSTGMVVTATYSDGSTAAVSATVTDGNALTAGMTSVTISYTEGGVTKTATQAITVNAASRTLSSIAVTTAPTKTTYTAGEDFDSTGMVVTATYSDGSTAAVSATVTDGTALTAGKTSVTISYTEGGVTKTATQAITVNAASRTLSSIAVTTAPTKTTYTAGEDFDSTGMVVTATYSDGSTAAVSATVTDGTALTAGKTSVTISYTEGGVTKTTTQTITVNAALSEFTITFDGNGGTPSISSMTTTSQKLATLPTASRSSYTFDGWYTAASSDTRITTTYVFSADTTVYAHWTYSGGSSSGGDGSSPSYTVTAPAKTDNGAVSTNVKSAKQGDTVTVTVTPDKGYVLETLTVLDKNGKELKLTDKGDGKYTFTMPAGKVEVKASFMEDNTMLNYFVDVKPNHFFYDAVLWAAKKGITKGINDAEFGPSQSCTRAQIVTFLWRVAGAPEPKSMGGFSDVSARSYYAKAVAWAIENGITGGTGDGKFDPDAICTRAQAAAFLYRASGSPAVSGGSAFSDVAENAYYADAVAWAEKNGVTGGIGGGLFGSGNDCTRAQIVTFLYRAYQGK